MDIKTKPTAEKQYRNITELENWDKNPRTISDLDFTRLKNQINALGQYKPLIITADGIVLGGNMRLRAYRELGWKQVWVSVVDAPTEAKMLEYALSDNDSAGRTDEEKLAELLHASQGEFNYEDYKVDVWQSKGIEELLNSFTPAGNELDLADRDTDADTTDSKLDTYQNGTIRQIVVYFTVDEYQEIVPLLEKARATHKVENNTELLFKLLKG